MLIPKSHIIETHRLRLRLPSQADFPFIFSATRHLGFNDGMPWDPPESESDCQAPLARNIKAWEEGGGYSFSIEKKETHAFVGRISIRNGAETKIWNVGFWTHPDHQGQGFMTEALVGILDLGFITFQAIQIEADYATWNKASERVLEKNGFQFVRFIEEGFLKNGKWVAENQVALKREDWLERQIS